MGGYRDQRWQSSRDKRKRSPSPPPMNTTPLTNDKKIELEVLHPVLMGIKGVGKENSTHSSLHSSVSKLSSTNIKEEVLQKLVPVVKKNPYLTTMRTVAPRKGSMLNFASQGKYTAEAELKRMEMEFERLRREVSDTLGMVGVEADLVTDLSSSVETVVVPEYEWWDLPFLTDNQLPNFTLLNDLIQHPPSLDHHSSSSTATTPKALFLTKEERKKLRRQRRLADHKEKQEKIKLGLLPPEAQKVRISNIAKVLSSQSVQEPSRVEAEIRAAADARLEAHLQANAERSELAKELKLESKNNNVVGGELQAAIFKVWDLRPKQWRFKVAKNAEQLGLAGYAVFHEGEPTPTTNKYIFSLLYVEGPAGAIRKYKQLMMNRIKWDQAPEGSTCAPFNECLLVWEGSGGISEGCKLTPSKFIFRLVKAESEAKEFLSHKSLDQFWITARDI